MQITWAFPSAAPTCQTWSATRWHSHGHPAWGQGAGGSWQCRVTLSWAGIQESRCQQMCLLGSAGLGLAQLPCPHHQILKYWSYSPFIRIHLLNIQDKSWASHQERKTREPEDAHWCPQLHRGEQLHRDTVFVWLLFGVNFLIRGPESCCRSIAACRTAWEFWDTWSKSLPA